MALHPIKALDHVLEEYRDYLRTEFRAKDTNLRAALDRELDAPGFLAQEPFFQAHRPFKAGKAWRELPLDARLAQVMEQRSNTKFAYLHQSEAIQELLSPTPRSVVVTTGTGSGKTEAFLLPVIQNAFDDAVRFKKHGLTAILVYPMNALANDQKLRIADYLEGAGFAGAVRVEQYDRTTSQSKRDEMRANPPHILLTNYMMLEYLLVRPADRDGIFANHRCRFLILDEVHTYRGTLGSNIALLVRRLRVHLARARQDWRANVGPDEQAKRFPSLIAVGTSATIKSVAEEDRPREEVIKLRDEAVQEFFGTLAGVERSSIRVFGEELQDIPIPGEARYPAQPGRCDYENLDVSNVDTVRKSLCTLAGVPDSTDLAEAVRKTRLLWDLNRWLIRRPMSVSQIISQIREEIAQRRTPTDPTLLQEALSALVVGAALPDGTQGALRLRVHRFIRGGWKFYRCVNPDCGRLYPKGEEQCTSCNHRTAPLYLCRNCGADYLRFTGDFATGPLQPSADLQDGPEYMLYEPARFNLPPIAADDSDTGDDGNQSAYQGTRGQQQIPLQIARQPLIDGSFDPVTLRFSNNPNDFSLRVTLAPARTRCLCCGGTAGSRSVLTPVALGTSAAVKVLSEGLVESLTEANRDRPGQDKKERLLVFSDSRQDAAHQARFIIFSSRYDRMRRRLVQLIQQHKELTVQRAVELLGELAEHSKDNPYVPEATDWINDEARARIQAWEEAPLLDEISVNAGYRATVINLGLIGVKYHRLDEYVRVRGPALAQSLGIQTEELEHLCRVLLDEVRTRGALSRPMLQFNPAHVACPLAFKLAEWERQLRSPQGYPLTAQGEVATNIDQATLPIGIKCHNAWRRPGVGGRGPSLQGLFENLMNRFGGNPPTNDQPMAAVLDFLKKGDFLTPVELCGARDRRRLLQVNADIVRLVLLNEQTRLRCEVCGELGTGARPTMPCPRCHGVLVRWPDTEVDQDRTVKRIRKKEAIPLVAREHTAQVTTEERAEIEDRFKASGAVSPVNLLSCSPTLEMGIDVGGLDAIVLRNVPPRPDNYAQRGGRAGRRSRVGMVIGYARSTPHDQYFYDKPREMIAGEVPAPAVNLGNRDVIVRHLFAIVFGAANPGLSGKMVDYVEPKGTLKEEAITALVEAVKLQTDHAIQLAREAWGPDVLERARLSEAELRQHLTSLPDRVRRVFDCTARQVIELRTALERYAQELQGRHAGVRAADLVARLLGIPSDQRRQNQEADDRSAGYPLRRFAEFGLLPGYEFPSEPASLRLLGDPHEEDPISVTRRFGIGQFQPDAHVYARSRRWKVIGLDTSSPWNPQSDTPTWTYRVCSTCALRYNADQPRCPRCQTAGPGVAHPAFDFAGFLAKREERPILDEEDRFAVRNLVRLHPQWDGSVTGRWSLGPGWALRLSRLEEMRWVNEGLPPTPNDLQAGIIMLHQQAKGYLLCPSCGNILQQPAPVQAARGGRRNAQNRPGAQATNGHSNACPVRGNNPVPVGITTSGKVEILRLVLPVPHSTPKPDIEPWGLTLGYALLSGIQHHFMLGSGEMDFELEGPWDTGETSARYGMVSLAFIDPSLGGSGYLERVAENFHHVAARAIDHLDHRDCQTACYRCLKSYYNQRYHDQLAWPLAMPALEELRHAEPTRRALETGDIDDPRPWLEAYAAGVGSPLELKFVRLFEQHGFHPEKQVPVSPSDGEAAISVADFAVPQHRVAIYVDGAAFHTGANLRRDRFIRTRLREGTPPWKVVELNAADLRRGVSLVDELKAL
jgi:hypothetical protein